MNFSLKSLVLLLLVSSILFACKNESKVGLDVLPQGQHIGTYMEDTFSVELTTILPDSVSTLNPYNIWVGDINDPNFGKLSATTFTQVAMSSPGYVFPTDAEYDSLTFTFKYGDIKFGDTTQNFKLNIYKLNELIDSATTYYNFSKLNYNNSPIGTITFNPANFKNRHVDSVSVKLDDAIGNELLTKFNQTDFSTAIAFNHYFKGLVLSSDGNNSAIIGGSLTSDSVNSNRLSRVVIHYHSKATPATALQYHFPIYSSSRKFTNFTSDRTGTPISSITKVNDSLSTQNTSAAYLQAGSGIKVKLTLPNLKKLKQQIGDIAINRAELIIPNTGSTNQTTNKAPSLFMYQANANGSANLSSSSTMQYVQTDGTSISGTSNPLLINFDYTKNQYSIVITDYLQALMYDKVSQYYSLIPSSTGGENFIMGSKNHPTAPIKLRVHYSKIQ